MSVLFHVAYLEFKELGRRRRNFFVTRYINFDASASNSAVQDVSSEVGARRVAGCHSKLC